MRRNSNRPSVVLLIAALALAACQSTPAVPPTQTPINPKDTFATPGAPTPFLPTMTPPPTVRPTATAVPPSAVPATVTVPTLAPTKVGTPTPTPVIVNGQPKMWWVDQMVKQADGSFMAPEAVRDAIRRMAADFFGRRATGAESDSLAKAKEMITNRFTFADEFFVGQLRTSEYTTTASQVQVMVSGLFTPTDVRAFSPDGQVANLLIEHSGTRLDIYDTATWASLNRGLLLPDYFEILQVRFDLADSRWKVERVLLTQRK